MPLDHIPLWKYLHSAGDCVLDVEPIHSHNTKLLGMLVNTLEGFSAMAQYLSLDKLPCLESQYFQGEKLLENTVSRAVCRKSSMPSHV